MIVTPRIAVRVGIVLLLAVLIQISLLSHIPVLGSVANLVPVVIVSIGLLGGAVSGAVCGFAAGLLLDVTIGGTPGVASLSLMAAGYLAGRWREGYDIVSALVPPLLSGALCAVSAAVFGLLTLTLGVDASVSIVVLREVFVQGLLGVLLAVPVFPLIRRILRPALIDDARPARGRVAGPTRVRGERTGWFGMITGQRGL
jgi:rod shape-determining protein MreD